MGISRSFPRGSQEPSGQNQGSVPVRGREGYRFGLAWSKVAPSLVGVELVL